MYIKRDKGTSTSKVVMKNQTLTLLHKNTKSVKFYILEVSNKHHCQLKNVKKSLVPTKICEKSVNFENYSSICSDPVSNQMKVPFFSETIPYV